MPWKVSENSIAIFAGAPSPSIAPVTEITTGSGFDWPGGEGGFSACPETANVPVIRRTVRMIAEITFTFLRPYPSAPMVFLQRANAIGDTAYWLWKSSSTTDTIWEFIGTPAVSTNYALIYMVVGVSN